MIQTFCRLVAALAILLSAPSTADNINSDSPEVMLTGVTASIEVDGLQDSDVTITIDGKPLMTQYTPGETLRAEVLLQSTGKVELEIRRSGDLVALRSISVIPGWVSVLPPLLAILLSFALRSVIPSLFAGLINRSLRPFSE